MRGPKWTTPERDLLAVSKTCAEFVKAYHAMPGATPRPNSALESAFYKRAKSGTATAGGPPKAATVSTPPIGNVLPFSPTDLDLIIERLKEVRDFKIHQEMLPPSTTIPKAPSAPDVESLLVMLNNRHAELIELNRELLAVAKNLAKIQSDTFALFNQLATKPKTNGKPLSPITVVS